MIHFLNTLQLCHGFSGVQSIAILQLGLRLSAYPTQLFVKVSKIFLILLLLSLLFSENRLSFAKMTKS